MVEAYKLSVLAPGALGFGAEACVEDRARLGFRG